MKKKNIILVATALIIGSFYSLLEQAIKRTQLAQNQRRNAVRRRKEKPPAVCFGSHFPANFLHHQAPEKINYRKN